MMDEFDLNNLLRLRGTLILNFKVKVLGMNLTINFIAEKFI